MSEEHLDEEKMTNEFVANMLQTHLLKLNGSIVCTNSEIENIELRLAEEREGLRRLLLQDHLLKNHWRKVEPALQDKSDSELDKVLENYLRENG